VPVPACSQAGTGTGTGRIVGFFSVAGFEMILQRHVSHYLITYYLPSGIVYYNSYTVRTLQKFYITVFCAVVNLSNAVSDVAVPYCLVRLAVVLCRRSMHNFYWIINSSHTVHESVRDTVKSKYPNGRKLICKYSVFFGSRSPFALLLLKCKSVGYCRSAMALYHPLQHELI